MYCSNYLSYYVMPSPMGQCVYLGIQDFRLDCVLILS
jgi:hypothetical protein